MADFFASIFLLVLNFMAFLLFALSMNRHQKQLGLSAQCKIFQGSALFKPVILLTISAYLGIEVHGVSFACITLVLISGLNSALIALVFAYKPTWARYLTYLIVPRAMLSQR